MSSGERGGWVRLLATRRWQVSLGVGIVAGALFALDAATAHHAGPALSLLEFVGGVPIPALLCYLAIGPIIEAGRR